MGAQDPKEGFGGSIFFRRRIGKNASVACSSWLRRISLRISLERLLVLVGTAVCYIFREEEIIRIMCDGETGLVLQPRVLV